MGPGTGGAARGGGALGWGPVAQAHDGAANGSGAPRAGCVAAQVGGGGGTGN